MSETLWIEIGKIIVALATVISPVLIGVMTYRLRKIELLSKATHDNTNSMKDALVASTKIASFAEGREAGRRDEEEKKTP